MVEAGNKAFVFNITHPSRKTYFEATLDANGTNSYQSKRSSLHVAEPVVIGETLDVIRDKTFDICLPYL